MLGKIKTWFTEDTTSQGLKLNLVAELINLTCQQRLPDQIVKELRERISEKFLEIHGDTIRKEILQNKDFADSVYNAIVLKKADKI